MKNHRNKLERAYQILVEDILEDSGTAREVITEAGFDPALTQLEGLNRIQELQAAAQELIEDQAAPKDIECGFDLNLYSAAISLLVINLSPTHSLEYGPFCTRIPNEIGDSSDIHLQRTESDCQLHGHGDLQLN